MPRIYHIKHADTLGGIIKEGGIWCDRECQCRELRGTAVGYTHIKERRMRRSVPLPPRGTLGDYVPFYFAPRSPMLYVIHHGGNPEYDGGQTPIVHFVSSVEAVAAARPALRWLFTDGHAEVALSDYYDDVRKLDEVIDWDVMRSTYWNDTQQDGDRKRRRQAEFLVHRFLPWELVSTIGVVNRAMADRVEQVLADSRHRPVVAVAPEWYY